MKAHAWRRRNACRVSGGFGMVGGERHCRHEPCLPTGERPAAMRRKLWLHSGGWHVRKPRRRKKSRPARGGVKCRLSMAPEIVTGARRPRCRIFAARIVIVLYLLALKSSPHRSGDARASCYSIFAIDSAIDAARVCRGSGSSTLVPGRRSAPRKPKCRGSIARQYRVCARHVSFRLFRDLRASVAGRGPWRRRPSAAKPVARRGKRQWRRQRILFKCLGHHLSAGLIKNLSRHQ